MKAAASLLSSLVASILTIIAFLIFKTSGTVEQQIATTHRVAILIPFLCDGPESIPPYLNLFVTAAAGSSSLVDFFIFHNGVLDYFYYHDMPSNVKLINLGSTESMMEHFVRVVDRRREDFALESRETLVKILTAHVPRYPYVLVEFKPALGHVFADYIQGYTHWGYSDLDIVFGDLPTWITTEELDNFDIVTYGFGDADRVYLRGQFTIHQNKPDTTNQLWRDCEYLSKMDERFADILSGKTKLHFESAEACYSVKVMQQADVKVKFAVKAFTDVQSQDVAYSHGMYFSTLGNDDDKSVLYKPVDASHGKELISVNDRWFEQPDYAVKQVEFGQHLPIGWLKDPSVNCMYWVRDIYQSELCIRGATSRDSIFLNKGHLYKRNYENTNLPTGIVSAPFFHFQEWKRYYRYNQNAVIDRASKATWVLTKEGALPVPSNDGASRIPSPLGIKPSAWRGNRQQLPPHPYCITSGPRKFPPVPPAPGCEVVVSWRSSERVELVSKAPAWRRVNAELDVTLALTLQITAKQARENLEAILDIAVANVDAWQNQPSVLIVHLGGATESTTEHVRSRLATILNAGCLIAMIGQTENAYVSRKALLNMAVDAAPTRWVVSGVELERGLVVSKEAAAICRRQAEAHRHQRGQVLFLPQFAITDVKSGKAASVADMLRWKRENQFLLRHPADFEEGICEDNEDESSNELFTAVDELWWSLTAASLDGTAITDQDDLVSTNAEVLKEVETSLLNAMTDDEGYAVSSNDSPIVMVDNRGPYPGVWTHTMVREVEEFGGKQCYNAFRLAQLIVLGYDFSLVAGAFAASTRATRDVALAHINEDELGASRCDGCIMFRDEQADILGSILLDERARVSKAAVLWTEH